MNVYYLPSRQAGTPELAAAAPRWSVLRARAHRAWWRLRLTVIEVWAVVRRGGGNRLDEHIWLTDDEPAPRPRMAGPARILDFEAARRRRALAAV